MLINIVLLVVIVLITGSFYGWNAKEAPLIFIIGSGLPVKYDHHQKGWFYRL